MPTESDAARLRRGVVVGNVVAVRSAPDSSSEQVTQVLLGQRVSVVSETEGWLEIRAWDGYPGWVRKHSIRLLNSHEPDYASEGRVARVHSLIADIHALPDTDSPIVTKATVGVELEVIGSDSHWVHVALPDGSSAYAHACHLDLASNGGCLRSEQGAVVRTALRFVGVPYLWGGVSPFGIDCSGFVQLGYRLHGFSLPRNSYLQAEDARGRLVGLDSLAPADLLFFGSGSDDARNGITHVAMMVDASSYIHSSSAAGVAVNPLDDDSRPHRPKLALRFIGV